MYKASIIRLLHVYYLAFSVLGPIYSQNWNFSCNAPSDNHKALFIVLSFLNYSSIIYHSTPTSGLASFGHHMSIIHPPMHPLDVEIDSDTCLMLTYTIESDPIEPSYPSIMPLSYSLASSIEF